MIFHAIVDVAPKVLGMGGFAFLVYVGTRVHERALRRREIRRMFTGNRRPVSNPPMEARR